MTDPIEKPIAEDSGMAGSPIVQKFGKPLTKQEVASKVFQRKKNREADELSAVLATDEGQAVVMRILDGCGIYEDAILTEAQQGQRKVGIRLIRAISALSPDSYPNLLLNHSKRQLRYRAEEDAIEMDASKT